MAPVTPVTSSEPVCGREANGGVVAGIDDIHDDIERRIAQHGWTAIAVHGDPERNHPSFTYSVAFEETFGTPEVVFIGFEPRLSQSLVAGMAESLKRKSLILPEQGGRSSGIIADFDVLLRPVDPEITREIALVALRRAYPDRIRLLQVCLPDPGGRLPGEPGCDARYARIQDPDVFRD